MNYHEKLFILLFIIIIVMAKISMPRLSAEGILPEQI